MYFGSQTCAFWKTDDVGRSPSTTEIAEMETVLWCPPECEEMEEIIYILNTNEQFQNLNTKYLTI